MYVVSVIGLCRSIHAVDISLNTKHGNVMVALKGESRVIFFPFHSADISLDKLIL